METFGIVFFSCIGYFLIGFFVFGTRPSDESDITSFSVAFFWPLHFLGFIILSFKITIKMLWKNIRR
jgi:hypothetical protein